jgi:hypothetical protein
LFGAEKSGKWSLINTSQELINEDSRVLSGGIGQPPKLLRLWNTLTRAMNTEAARAEASSERERIVEKRPVSRFGGRPALGRRCP